MEDKNEEKVEQKELKCVTIVNKNPDKLGEEGKLEFAHDIIEELPPEEVDKFIRRWGYNR